ncbi:hypothetical protein ACOLNO_002950 [Vibrio parahaemolyticus]
MAYNLKPKNKNKQIVNSKVNVESISENEHDFDSIVEFSSNATKTRVRISEELFDEILNSDFFKNSVPNTFCELVKKASTCGKVFEPDNECKQKSGKPFLVDLPENCIEFFNAHKQQHLLTISLNNFLCQLVQWQLAGNPESEQEPEILSYEDTLNKVAIVAVNLVKNTKGLTNTNLANLLGVPTKTISVLKNMKFVGTLNFIKKLNLVFDDIQIDEKKMKVSLINDGKVKSYSFEQFLNYRPSK